MAGKLAFQVSRVYISGPNKGQVDNAGLYFDRIVAEDRLYWWEKRHADEEDFIYRIDEKLVGEDQWERLRAAAHFCDVAAIMIESEKK